MKAIGKAGASRYDEIELDRHQGGRVADAVDRLVAVHGGTNAGTAAAIGLGPGTLSRLRARPYSARWRPETIDAVARAAGVTRDALLAGKVAP